MRKNEVGTTSYYESIMPQILSQRSRILWDVLEEHLEEAAFLWVQRERALCSPEYVLSDLENGDEARLLAHLDGLVVGGEPVARQLLLPVLGEEEEPGRLASATYALLDANNAKLTHSVLERLVANEAQQPGVLRALTLSRAAGLDSILLGMLPRLAPPQLSAVLKLLAFRHVDTSAFLERLPVKADHTALFTSVLHAAGACRHPVAAPWVSRGMNDPRPQVRDAAITAGLLRGSRAAWLTCRRVVEQQNPEPRVALLALAMSSGASDIRLLLAAASNKTPRAEVLWALGFSGRVAAVEAALGMLATEDGPLALETIATITGLLPDEYIEPSPEADEKEATDEDVTRVEEASLLPGPKPRSGRVRVAAVQEWWRRQRSRFSAEGRYWQGQPWTEATLLSALQEARLHLRPALSWGLSVLSRGTYRIEPRSWGWLQRQHIHAARGLRLDGLTHTFDRIMTA
jgi:uncharacterized protein (TIGR02270 family)